MRSLPVVVSPLTMVTGRDIVKSLISLAKCLIYIQGQQKCEQEKII